MRGLPLPIESIMYTKIMKNIHLEKVANHIYQITLPNDNVESVLTDGRLDMASTVHGVPKNSSLIVSHQGSQSSYSQNLTGNCSAKNFHRIAYILSGHIELATMEEEHVNALQEIYPSVKSFHNSSDALAWCIKQTPTS